MKFPALILLTAILLSSVEASPLPKRIWQLQDYDMAHILRVIDLAPKYGINEVQLSHHIIMDADEALENEGLVADINKVCDYAHKRGLRVSVWTHELERVPGEYREEGKVQLDEPGLWKWLDDKYTKLFQLCPEVDGLVLTFHETEVSVYDNGKVSSKLSPEKRVAKLIDALANICNSRGKELVVRSFCYEPDQLQFIKDGYALAESEFVVMSKCQPHDWQPYYPNNPLIGDVGGRPQIMEIDCGHEFLGQGDIPYIDIAYMKQRMDHGISRGMAGAVARIERYGNHSLDTPNWADVVAFSRILQDPSVSADELLNDYLVERYGKEAAPKLAPAFERTFDTVNKAFFTLGFWITTHSRIPSYGYAQGHIEGRGVDLWDSDPKWTEIKKRLLSPDAATLREIQREKDMALALCRKSIAEIEAAKPLLSDADYDELMTYFKREEAVVRAWRAYNDAFFALRAYETSGDSGYRVRAELVLDDLKNVVAEYGDQINKMTGDGGDDNVSRINDFMREARERLAKTAVKPTSQ